MARKPKEPAKGESRYEKNKVFLGPLSSRFYFAPKVEVLSETLRLVVGNKYDVTDDLQPYLLKRYRKKE